MNALIEVFRMTEIDPKKRAKVIVKLGEAINYHYGSNVTEPLVYELVSILDPDNEAGRKKGYRKKKSELKEKTKVRRIPVGILEAVDELIERYRESKLQ